MRAGRKPAVMHNDARAGIRIQILWRAARSEGIGKPFRYARGIEDGARCQETGEARGIIGQRRAIRRAHELRRKAGEESTLGGRNQELAVGGGSPGALEGRKK